MPKIPRYREIKTLLEFSDFAHATIIAHLAFRRKLWYNEDISN